MNFLSNILILLFVFFIGALAGIEVYRHFNKPIIVTEIQERERVRTRIEERPDGSKVTTIDKTVKKDQIKAIPKPEWSISVSASRDALLGRGGIYTLTVHRALILGLSVGLYARTDKEIGVSLQYSF